MIPGIPGGWDARSPWLAFGLALAIVAGAVLATAWVVGGIGARVAGAG